MLTVAVKPLRGVSCSTTGSVPGALNVGELRAAVKRKAGFTAKLCETGVAAVYCALPGCVAWMMQVPAVTSVAVAPDTVHTEGVNEVKTTARPELAEAVRLAVCPAVPDGIGLKVVVCGTCVAVPLRGTIRADGFTFRLFAVSTNDPLMLPACCGVKLMGRVQEAPAASVPGVEPLATTGQVAEPPKVKFIEMLGFIPEAGTRKLSGALPMFCSVNTCGLSLLLEPTGVLAKLRLGGVTRFSSFTAPLPESAT
jgi:hypothetical protein